MCKMTMKKSAVNAVSQYLWLIDIRCLAKGWAKKGEHTPREMYIFKKYAFYGVYMYKV